MYSRWLRGLPSQNVGAGRAEHEDRSASAKTFLDSQAEKPGVTTVDPVELFCSGNEGSLCPAEQNGQPLYFDQIHLNGFGADGLAAVVLARLDLMLM